MSLSVTHSDLPSPKPSRPRGCPDIGNAAILALLAALQTVSMAACLIASVAAGSAIPSS